MRIEAEEKILSSDSIQGNPNSEQFKDSADRIRKEERMKKTIRTQAAAIILALTAASLSGCGTQASASTTTVTDQQIPAAGNAGTGASDNADAKVIRIGTGNSYNPACYLDDNGNLAGYEYEVLQAVDALLPQYTFTYQTFDFKNVILALDSNKIDLAAHQYEWNEERDKNYLFGKEGYTVFDNYVWVTDENNNGSIKSLDDLGGLTTRASAGDNIAFFFENYNKQHPDNKINLDYTTPATNEETASYYKSNKWNFMVAPKKDIELTNEAYKGLVHFNLAFDKPITSSNTYYLYRKNDAAEEQLRDDVDGAVKELKKSGKLAQISIKYWGGDYTVSNAAYDNSGNGSSNNDADSADSVSSEDSSVTATSGN